MNWRAVPLLALILAAPGAGWAATIPDYPSVKIPAGGMRLELPLNPYLNTDYLSIPVTIPKAFLMGRFEVNRRLWQACHESGACEKAALPAKNAGPDHPMVGVNWHEAMAFVRWYSKRTGEAWRLPTQHEWFYAAAVGKGWRSEEKRYSYADLDKLRETPKQTLPGGGFGENAWGLSDMQGNVWEWTLSCYVLAADRLLKPESPAALQDPECCVTRVCGGEHRAEVPDFISDTYQGGCSSLKPAANLGFRMVRDL